jgi:hypothetical protein
MNQPEQGNQAKPEATKQSGPQASFNNLPNGRVVACVSLGEFTSQPEAEQAVNETVHDLNLLRALDQVEYEITHSQDLGDETLEQMLEADLREQCDRIASSLGMTELWQQSEKFPNFQEAWIKWRAAWYEWLGGNRRFPETKGPNKTRYLWMQKQFLAGVRSGRGKERDFYRNHSLLLFYAAHRGDADFLKQFAEATRRKSFDPRCVQHSLITTWMPAALWSCGKDTVAKFLTGRCDAWRGWKSKHHDEDVRRAWQLLHLWHDPNYRIKDFDTNWQPVFRS